jgi:hypothetical protein
MHHSSIFNFRMSFFTIRWQLSGWVMCSLIFLGCAELILRQPAVLARLPRPEPTLWHAENVQTKLDYLHVLETERRVNVLFLGNSTVLAGINPSIFDQTLQTGVESAAAFNGALEGLPAYGALQFAEIYTQYARPQTIIYGITPQDINQNSPSVKEITDKIQRATLVQAKVHPGLPSWLLRTLVEHSYFFRYRYVLHQLLISGGRFPQPVKIYFDRRGFVASTERLADVSPAGRSKYYNIDGVLNYTPEGEQANALQALLEWCQRQGIRLILVNMPLADDYYGNFRSPADYQHYHARVASLAATYATPFWDAEALEVGPYLDDTSFADFNHLNVDGAAKLSTWLAERYQALLGLTQTR